MTFLLERAGYEKHAVSNLFSFLWQTFLSRCTACQRKFYRVAFRYPLHCLIIIRSRKFDEAIRIKLASPRIQLRPVFLGQFRPERVDGDDDGASVGLELKKK